MVSFDTQKPIKLALAGVTVLSHETIVHFTIVHLVAKPEVRLRVILL